MHPHEEATIRAFIAAPRRARWLESLASPKQRTKVLDRLNHCQDFDARYASPLESNADVIATLTARGAPATCYVVSDSPDIDGRELPLADALTQAEIGGWGTIICCVPGQLGYFYGECGERRLLLERPRRSKNRSTH
jgi:hypothetical protein